MAGNGPEITVTVNYQSRTESSTFLRGAKVEEVLSWAITTFGIDAALATEMELTLPGAKDELAGGKPLAALVHGTTVLAVDLVRGDIANGEFDGG